MNHHLLLRGPVPKLALAVTLLLASAAAMPFDDELQLSISRIYWEYNSTANDLGVHVTLDGEDWYKLKIEKPSGATLFQVKGSGPYQTLGMTELFFEGAEPSLDDVPLGDLLKMFPEGEYDFEGFTVEGDEIEGEGQFSHAIPAGPTVWVDQGSNDYLRINWTLVTSPPAGFPNRPINVVSYQVIVEPSFQVTLPAPATSVTVSPEFVASLPLGVNKFEVLAVDQTGNQTITEGTFVK